DREVADLDRLDLGLNAIRKPTGVESREGQARPLRIAECSAGCGPMAAVRNAVVSAGKLLERTTIGRRLVRQDHPLGGNADGAFASCGTRSFTDLDHLCAQDASEAVCVTLGTGPERETIG